MNEHGPRSHERETGPVMLDRFYVIDFDRCLGNIEAVTTLMYRAFQATGINAATMEGARTQVEATAGSFDVAAWIKEHCTEEEYRAFIQNYLELPFDNASLLEPGAAEFLERLVKNNIPFAIMTHGGDDWQRTKLQRVGLGEVPTVVMSSKEKGKEIASWEGAGKHSLPGFQIPEELVGSERVVLAREVVLIDDKAPVFDDLPEAARGYVIQHSEELKPSQMGDIPDNVVRMASFKAIADREGIPPLERVAA